MDTPVIRAIKGEIVSDDSWLPEPESVRGGEGPYIIPIVDDNYGGVIAWANTMEQAERIVTALSRKGGVMSVDYDKAAAALVGQTVKEVVPVGPTQEWVALTLSSGAKLLAIIPISLAMSEEEA
jgi:hypothetical protein